MDRVKTYFRISLPFIFTVYVGLLIAFTHIHIVNGVTIVHSHPYQKSNGQPVDHEHSFAEFQLLHQISTIEIAGPLFILFLLAALCTQFNTVRFILIQQAYANSSGQHIVLRGPPCFLK